MKPVSPFNVCQVRGRGARDLLLQMVPTKTLYETCQTKSCKKICQDNEFWHKKLLKDYPQYAGNAEDAKTLYHRIIYQSGDLYEFSVISPEGSLEPWATNMTRVFPYNDFILSIDVVGNLYISTTYDIKQAESDFKKNTKFTSNANLYRYAKSLGLQDSYTAIHLPLDIQVSEVHINNLEEFILDTNQNLYRFKFQKGKPILILIAKNVVSVQAYFDTFVYINDKHELFGYRGKDKMKKLASNIKKVQIYLNQDNRWKTRIYALDNKGNFVWIQRSGIKTIKTDKWTDFWVSTYKYFLYKNGKVYVYKKDDLQSAEIYKIKVEKFIDATLADSAAFILSGDEIYAYTNEGLKAVLPNVVDAIATGFTMHRGEFPVFVYIRGKV